MLESQVYQGGVPAPPTEEQPSFEPQIEVEESREDFARVIAAPLLSGFGITLGNALRRVLLSALPGAAVTSVRIDGVQRVNLRSERDSLVLINFDPYRSAALGVQVTDIANIVRRAVNATGGLASVGRRQYTVRFLGGFKIDELGDLIVARRLTDQ